MKKNYLIVESPFQLLSALEAVQYYSIDSYCIYIRYSSSENNNNQMSYVVTNFHKIQRDIEFFSIKSHGHQFFDYLKMVFFLGKFCFFGVFSKRFFIGNYESRFLKLLVSILPKSKVVLLDDGAKSINIQSGFDDKKNLNMFTIFPLSNHKGQRIEKNNFVFLKNKMSELIHKNDLIFFLGAPLISAGIMSEFEYLGKLKKIIKLNNFENILYIPHRQESEDVINEISNFNGVVVKSIDYPVELYGLYNSAIPSQVISFYSTALVSMSLIYSIPATAYMFTPSPNDIEKHGKAINEVYKLYRSIINVERV